jgi:hypothetical protein
MGDMAPPPEPSMLEIGTAAQSQVGDTMKTITINRKKIITPPPVLIIFERLIFERLKFLDHIKINDRINKIINKYDLFLGNFEFIFLAKRIIGIAGINL